ncbi:hypothetical protein [Halosolutus gelatinilyticus]|uniref:hypothetical protein n=1 Tax=Halosolutus gelatinilyticus TaxID=2931975 RepID=UPI001FF202D4|nr:hypothetical protein [Halosolutus gelatinilyticus]
MQLEQRSRESLWDGTVPSAIDARVLGLVVVIAALAASVNVPYGGVIVAVAAFALLTAGGVVGHLLGERKLRRITDGLVDRWLGAGAQITDVTRSSEGMRTEWTVHTPEGEITIGGVALVPIARLSVEWQGVGDAMDASDADDDLDRLAESLFEEIFAIGDGPTRS